MYICMYIYAFIYRVFHLVCNFINDCYDVSDSITAHFFMHLKTLIVDFYAVYNE